MHPSTSILFHRSSYSYRPSIPLEFIRDELSFAEMAECIKFLREHNGACFDSTQTALDTKTAYPGLFEAGRKYDKIDIKGQIWWVVRPLLSAATPSRIFPLVVSLLYSFSGYVWTDGRMLITRMTAIIGLFVFFDISIRCFTRLLLHFFSCLFFFPFFFLFSSFGFLGSFRCFFFFLPYLLPSSLYIPH